MPHIKLEYTDNVQWKNPVQEILSELQKVLIQHAKVNPENCKSRATQLKDFLCSINSQSSGFVHIEISLLIGRTEVVKTTIGKECIKIIQQLLENIAQIQVSVEICDMVRENYFTTSQL